MPPPHPLSLCDHRIGCFVCRSIFETRFAVRKKSLTHSLTRSLSLSLSIATTTPLLLLPCFLDSHPNLNMSNAISVTGRLEHGDEQPPEDEVEVIEILDTPTPKARPRDSMELYRRSEHSPPLQSPALLRRISTPMAPRRANLDGGIEHVGDRDRQVDGGHQDLQTINEQHQKTIEDLQNKILKLRNEKKKLSICSANSRRCPTI
jgi:hypothetical protein